MSTMHNPSHPGETLREDVLPALGLSVTDAAAQLGVTRAALSRVLNGRAGISPEGLVTMFQKLIAERKAKLDSIQKQIFDKSLFMPVVEYPFPVVIGPRVGYDGVNGIPGNPYTGPYEDLTLKS